MEDKVYILLDRFTGTNVNATEVEVYQTKELAKKALQRERSYFLDNEENISVDIFADEENYFEAQASDAHLELHVLERDVRTDAESREEESI